MIFFNMCIYNFRSDWCIRCLVQFELRNNRAGSFKTINIETLRFYTLHAPFSSPPSLSLSLLTKNNLKFMYKFSNVHDWSERVGEWESRRLFRFTSSNPCKFICTINWMGITCMSTVVPQAFLAHSLCRISFLNSGEFCWKRETHARKHA